MGKRQNVVRCSIAQVALLLVLAVHVRAQDASCFGTDAGAASQNRTVHLDWAQTQDLAALKHGLDWKAASLFHCSARTDDQLYDTFADISVVIARYVHDASCFGGDAGVVATDWAMHRAWVRGKGRSNALGPLQWKLAAAFDCLDRPRQVSYYADISVLLAGVRLADPLPSAAAEKPKGPKPLSLSEIEQALGGGIPARRLAKLVGQYGVDFELTKDAEQRLRTKGADDALLLAVATNKK